MSDLEQNLVFAVAAACLATMLVLLVVRWWRGRGE